MEGWTIGVAIVVALYVAVRLVLRHYLPLDTLIPTWSKRKQFAQKLLFLGPAILWHFASRG